jgi:hypothetical protein
MLPAKQSKGGILHRQKAEAQRLGQRTMVSAAGTVAGTALLTVGFGWWTLGPLLGIAGLGYTGVQAWRWIQYRAKWGLKF